MSVVYSAQVRFSNIAETENSRQQTVNCWSLAFGLFALYFVLCALCFVVLLLLLLPSAFCLLLFSLMEIM